MKKLLTDILDNNNVFIEYYSPNCSLETKNLVNRFINAEKFTLVKTIFEFENINEIRLLLQGLEHFTKIKIPFFIQDIKTSVFIEFIDFFTDEVIKIHIAVNKTYFVENFEYISPTLQEVTLDILFEKDFQQYLLLAKKYSIGNIKRIFEKQPMEVFNYINSQKNRYGLLVELNKPDFILENLNNNLELSDDTIRYFLENALLTADLLKQIKQIYPLEKIYKIVQRRIPINVYFELLDSIKDIKWFLTLDLSLKELNDFIKFVKERYPEIYPIIIAKSGI